MDSVVATKHLSIGWSADEVLLKDIEFEVKRGEIFAILGASGCGKSTLLRTLIGLSRPLAGEVLIEGRRYPDERVEKPIFGVVFQSGALFGSLTVGENVALPLIEWTRLPRPVITDMACAKLRLVGLEESAEKLPAELSGGMRKRAALARAMALEPSLVFLDEPTTGLDPIMAAEIDELILKLNQALGVTVVMVTHQISSLRRLAHRCMMLDPEAKDIIAEGTPDDVARSDDERVRAFFESDRPS
ncbi:MAG: ATP-binding cassette domain-containing protein [Polyangiaceae bacterium]|nr:ATP-binding cassette domain-containing protein [Polyangiaceae bacterium]